MDDFDEMMQMLGLGDSEEAPKPPADDDSDAGESSIDIDNLDDELEKLLAADHEADQEQTFEAIEPGSPVVSRSIYDMGGILDESDGGAFVYSKEDAEAEAKKRNKRSLLDGLTVQKLLTAGFVLLFFFIGVGASAILAARAVAEQREETAALAHFTPISMPTDTANNANFIHINELLTVGEQQFTLLRISTGFSGTYFFFEEYFDADEYYILLYDQHRRLYVRHTFDMRTDPTLGTVLRFDPFLSDTTFLTLHIQNRDTREYGAFYYRLVGRFTPGAPLFINQPIPLTAGSDINTGLRISHAYFNNVESVIYYTFTGEFTTMGLRRREYSEATFIRLWDIVGGLMTFTEPQAAVHFAEYDAQIGRAAFSPLVSLHSQVRVSFHDLYYVYPNPPMDIPLRFLSGRDQDDPHTLYMDPFRLNLEGLAQQGHLIVLVMHGLDDSDMRLQTIVETSLEIDIGRGQTLTIPAEQVNVAPNGTDVVFNLRNYMGILNNVHIDRYSLILHSVEFAVPEVSVILDLTQAVYQPGRRHETAIANITSAFLSRLAYISGEITHTSIVGFAPEVLSDEILSETFARREVTGRSMYGARVVAGNFYDNYTFLAVVENEWAMGAGAELEFFRTVHQVIARSHEGIWSIVSDEIISL